MAREDPDVREGIPAHNGTAGMPDSIAERVYENAALTELVDLIEPARNRVLDVGSGSGANLDLLRLRGHEVVGLTVSELEAAVCNSRGHRVVVADISSGQFPIRPRQFDGAMLCHVLEHLAEPSVALRSLREMLAPGGAIFVALPNVLYYKQRWLFLRGQFRYTDTGIMDRTHLRFFDQRSARELIEDCGFRIDHESVVGGTPSFGLRQAAPGLWDRFDSVALRRFPGLFGFHLLYRAEPV